MTKLDPGQRVAVENACRFVASGRPGCLWIGGLAGTGKTTVAQEIARRFPDAPLLAPTNKAAAVLGKKLGRQAHTIHRAIMLYKGKAVDEEDGKLKPVFKDKSFNARLVLLDECSMVEEKLGNKLLACCNQIIAFGDPGQLGPVGKNVLPFFKGKPNVTLITNHRQGKAGDGIIRAAYAVRDGKRVFTIDSDEFTARCIPSDPTIWNLYFTNADRILCHQNKTRHTLNDGYRIFRGFTGPVRAGERLVAQRHILELGIIKSDDFRVLADWAPGTSLKLKSLDTEKVFHFKGAVIDKLNQPEPPDKVPFFAFGYVTTVHMAQGSEWSHVLIVDDYVSDEYRKWSYTGFTRGAEQVTVLSDRFPITEGWIAA
jgi:exodeoxyribonuclease-5